MKKILTIFALLIFHLFFLGQESYAKGSFIGLNFKRPHGLPVILNENEIFFAGGWDRHEVTDPKTGKWHHEADIFSARIYNLKTRKFKDLNSYLNVTRNYNGAIKYDDNNVLILGGYCGLNEKNKEDRECLSVAENYTISENKFELLDKMPLKYSCYGVNNRTIKKTKDKVFIITQIGIIEFDIRTKKFKKLIVFEDELKGFVSNANLIDKDNILIWGGNYYEINGKRFEGYKGHILKYNISTNKIVRLLTVDKPFYINPVTHGIPLDDNKILLSVKGDEDEGTIYVYNYIKNEIENLGKTGLGVLNTTGTYLGDNKVLLLGGVVDIGYEGITPPKYLNYAILDLKTRKVRKVSKATYFVIGSSELYKLNERSYYIPEFRWGKPAIFKY